MTMKFYEVRPNNEATANAIESYTTGLIDAPTGKLILMSERDFNNGDLLKTELWRLWLNDLEVGGKERTFLVEGHNAGDDIIEELTQRLFNRPNEVWTSSQDGFNDLMHNEASQLIIVERVEI